MTPKKRYVRSNSVKLKELKRRMATILGSAEQIKVFEANYTADQANQLAIRIEMLDELWKQYSEVQEEIELLEDLSGEEISEERLVFQNKYVELKALLVSKLPNLSVNTEPTRVASNSASIVSQSVRLPEIQIPKFDGNPELWIEFRDTFKSLIHANPNLTAIQKLHYLKDALIGEAHSSVANLEMSTEGYNIGWKLVEKRHNDTNFLIKRHISALFAIAPIKKESSALLMDLADQFDRHVSILNKLEKTEEHWNSVLVEALSRRLDTTTLKEWEKDCKEGERPDFDALVTFIRKQARTLQSVKMSHTPTATQETKIVVKSRSTNNFMIAEAAHKCPMCKAAHYLYECDQFNKLSPRHCFNIAKKYKLCINCLRGHHLAKNCNSSNCKSCGQRHHTLLHLPPAVDGNSYNSNQRTTFTAFGQQVENPQVQTQMYCPPHLMGGVSGARHPNTIDSFVPGTIETPFAHVAQSNQTPSHTNYSAYSAILSEGKPAQNHYNEQHKIRSANRAAEDSSGVLDTSRAKTEVFLATAIVRVEDRDGTNHFARVVLDSCSQCNFISEAVATKLRLRRTKTNTEVAGIGPGKVRVTESVTVKLRSRTRAFETSVVCLIIAKIPAILPSQNIDIRDWQVPRDVKLADPKFNISAGVDILLGAELFFSLLLSQQCKINVGYPLLQETVFGHIVSGMYAGRGANPSLCIISSASGLDAILERFWQVDDFDRGRALSLDDRWCEDHFNRTVSRRDDGRYVVRLPIREDRRPFLGDSYNLAQRRFLANERRFGYDQQLRDDYLRFMDEYAELGHLEPGLRTGNAAYRPRFLETMDSGLRSSFASTSKMAPRHSKPSGRRVSFVETREPSAVAMEHRTNNRHTSGQRRQVQGGRRPHHKGNLPACRSRSMPAANRNREQQIRKPSPAPDAAPDKPARTVKLSEARFKETDEAESE
ncbi:uncharacterized protein LOC120414059 [Culex pipiens pallens]|uniref:uncharacterized protein LOC120414059 n=1 Tax=Culex pipiens pallens TaxID=42434 RepID=UPI00195467AA|nr:uncharacterized protein LOC120414059 [Culex pipiens pallens]